MLEGTTKLTVYVPYPCHEYEATARVSAYAGEPHGPWRRTCPICETRWIITAHDDACPSGLNGTKFTWEKVGDRPWME